MLNNKKITFSKRIGNNKPFPFNIYWTLNGVKHIV